MRWLWTRKTMKPRQQTTWLSSSDRGTFILDLKQFDFCASPAFLQTCRTLISKANAKTDLPLNKSKRRVLFSSKPSIDASDVFGFRSGLTRGIPQLACSPCHADVATWRFLTHWHEALSDFGIATALTKLWQSLSLAHLFHPRVPFSTSHSDHVLFFESFSPSAAFSCATVNVGFLAQRSMIVKRDRDRLKAEEKLLRVLCINLLTFDVNVDLCHDIPATQATE